MIIFHKKCLLAEYSHEIIYTLFLSKTTKDVTGKDVCNLSSTAVVIGSLRVHNYTGDIIAIGKSLLKNHTGLLKVYLKLLYIYILILL